MANATDLVSAVPVANRPNHKPAFLRRVQIRGYKSIAFCDVTLEPLTILVGRNASGKSNFLDALRFLQDLMLLRTTDAVSARNGWRSIKCRSDNMTNVRIDIEASFHKDDRRWDAIYWFSIGLNDKDQPQIVQEQLDLKEVETGRRVGYRCTQGLPITWIGTEYFTKDSDWTTDVDDIEVDDEVIGDPRYITKWKHDRLLLSIIDVAPFLDFAEEIWACSFHRISPDSIREHQPISNNYTLAFDGNNLASILERLRRYDVSTLDRIIQYLRAVVPSVVNCRRIEYGERETIKFETIGHGGSHLEFDASSMSDGTLRVLAILAAAFRSKRDEWTGITVIDEPETSLHPAAIHALVDALDEATLRTQILLTTHSAEILDNPTIEPKNIRVVQMIDGQTIIAPVDEASVEIVRDKLGTLGSLERDNLLEPHLDEVDRVKQVLEGKESPL